MSRKNNAALTVAGAVLCNLLWGSAYPGIKSGYAAFGITDGTFDKILFAGIRFIIAGLIVLAAGMIANKSLPKITKGNFKWILATAAVSTACQYIFFYIGLSNTTGTNGSIFNSTSTFMAVIISHFVYADDKITPKKLIGSLVGFAGVLLVTIGGSAARFKPQGEGFILIAALCFVIGSMISKKAARLDNAYTVTGWNLFIGGIMLVLMSQTGGGVLPQINASGILVLLYLAVLSSAAFTIWTALMRSNPVSRISVYNFIIPVSGTILSALFLHESVSGWQYPVSLILVCAGIILVNIDFEELKGIIKR